MGQKVMDLYNDNISLVKSMVKALKYYAPGYTEEDFIQIGCIALWRAALDFDETKGYKFWTLAIKYIRKDISKVLKKVYNSMGRTQELTMRSLLEVVDTNSKGYDITLADIVPCDENIEEISTTAAMLELVFNNLDSKYSYLLKQCYLEDRSQIDLAKEFNVTRGTISKWVSSALIEARKILGVDLSHKQYYEKMNSSNEIQRKLKAS